MAKSATPPSDWKGSITLPSVRYDAGRDLAFSYQEGSTRFRILFTSLSKGVSRAIADSGYEADAQKIASAEYRRLGNMVQTIFQEWAPEGPGKFSYTFKNGSTKTWGHDEHLRDTIRAQVVGNLLTVRMAWWGWLTAEGRDTLPFRGTDADGHVKMYPFVDPSSGEVRFSPVIGPATRWAANGQSATERMKWVEHGMARVRYEHVLEMTCEIIAQRIAMMAGLMEGGMGGVTARKLAIPQHALRAQQKKGIRRARSAGASYGRTRRGAFKHPRKSRLYQKARQHAHEIEQYKEAWRETREEIIPGRQSFERAHRVLINRLFTHRNKTPRYIAAKELRVHRVVQRHVRRRNRELARMTEGLTRKSKW